MFVRQYTESPGTEIIGLGTYLPQQIVTSAQIETAIAQSGVAISPGFIERVTGVEERRVAAAGENASDLAVGASRSALLDAGVEASDIDLLIFASASHDLTEPATANIVQSKLGAARAETYDLKNACNSFMSALEVANAYLRAGMAKIVLVATGELPSRAIDLSFSSQHDVLDKFAHLTMGDAGAAAILACGRVGHGILATGGVTRGQFWELGTILGGGTMYPRDISPERAYLRSKGCELEERGRRDVPPVVAEVLGAVSWPSESVDVVATQQHSRRIIAEVVAMTGIPERRAVLPLRYAGNAAAANIPLALAEARERGLLTQGSRVVLMGASSGFSVLVSAICW